MIKNTIISLAVIVMLSACSQESKKTTTADTNATTQEPVIINGHTLPPMPDKTLNDATLLGIDSNNNGVRDDVEIWIYETYTEPVEIGLFMQSARAYQKVIVDPSKAYETKKYLDSYTSCVKYWIFRAEQNQETFHIDKYRDLEKEIGQVMFNSIERHMAYEKFNAELSGGVFSLLPILKEKCEFDKLGNLKTQK